MPHPPLPCHVCSSDSHILSTMSVHQACLGLGRTTNDRWNSGEKALQKKRADFFLSGLSKAGKTGVRNLYIDRQDLYDSPNRGLDDAANAFTCGSLPSNYEARAFYSQDAGYGYSAESAGVAIMSQSHLPTGDTLYPSFSSKAMLDKSRGKNSEDGHIDEECICCLEDATSEVKQLYPVKLNSTSSWQHADPTVSLRSLQQPLMASGWLYLGTCGNALITRRGNDARCFHQWGLVCEREDWQGHLTGLEALPSPVGVQAHESLLARLAQTENTTEIFPLDHASALKLTSKSHRSERLRSEKLKKKSISRQTKQAKRAAPPRDLFGRKSFHLCEVIFCYPFRSSNIAAFQCLSRESLVELVEIMNQISVVIAATGVALILFVVSRMLSVNATFDNNKIISIVCGSGLLSLSLAMKRVADVLKCMADACTGMRLPQKEHLTRLQKELQGFAYKAFPLIALCVVRFC